MLNKLPGHVINTHTRGHAVSFHFNVWFMLGLANNISTFVSGLSKNLSAAHMVSSWKRSVRRSFYQQTNNAIL